MTANPAWTEGFSIMAGRITLPQIPAELTTDLHRPALPADPATRATAAVGLLVIGVIHVLEIQGQLTGAVWLTVGFCLLSVAAPIAGLWVLARPSVVAWGFGALVAASAAAGYILTRSVPVPGDTGDDGNWLEPLGVAALMTEIVVVALALLVLTSLAGARRPGARG
jgi:hypothetical protein